MTQNLLMTYESQDKIIDGSEVVNGVANAELWTMLKGTAVYRY